MAGLTRLLGPSEVMRHHRLILTPSPYYCYIVTRWVWVMPLGCSQAHRGVKAHTQAQIHAQRASAQTVINAQTKVDSAGSHQPPLEANQALIRRQSG